MSISGINAHKEYDGKQGSNGDLPFLLHISHLHNLQL